MIDVITDDELRRLAETEGEHCVSVYLPTHRAGRERSEDRIRFKNAMGAARDELVAVGLRGPVADELLAPAVALEDDASFWAHAERGVAVFVGPDTTTAYRLAATVDELVVVNERFHITPLVPLVASDEVFHVLVLGQGAVRLLRGSRYEVTELGLGEIPPSLAAALPYDDRESQLHSHGASRVGPGRVVATFHGHGVGIDTRGADLDRFLGAVDLGLVELIGSGRTPLVLAGVDSTVARFRQLSRYPHIVRGDVLGNAATSSPAELHDRAWTLVRPVFDEARERARSAVAGGAPRIVTGVAETLLAAIDGRVEVAFVARGARRWGAVHRAERRVEDHDARRPGDRDLLDAIVVETLIHGGEAFVVDAEDVPGTTPVAAALRY